MKKSDVPACMGPRAEGTHTVSLDRNHERMSASLSRLTTRMRRSISAPLTTLRQLSDYRGRNW